MWAIITTSISNCIWNLISLRTQDTGRQLRIHVLTEYMQGISMLSVEHSHSLSSWKNKATDLMSAWVKQRMAFNKCNYNGHGLYLPTFISQWLISDITHVMNYTRPSMREGLGMRLPAQHNTEISKDNKKLYITGDVTNLIWWVSIYFWYQILGGCLSHLVLWTGQTGQATEAGHQQTQRYIHVL